MDGQTQKFFFCHLRDLLSGLGRTVGNSNFLCFVVLYPWLNIREEGGQGDAEHPKNIARLLLCFQAGCSVNKVDNTYNECVKRRQTPPPPPGRKHKSKLKMGLVTQHGTGFQGNWDQEKTFKKLSVTGGCEEIDCAFMPQWKAPTTITPTCLSLLPSRL